MPKSKGTRTAVKTAWCQMNASGECVWFGENKNSITLGCRDRENFLKLFGWLPGKRPVEVRLERVHRRQTGAPRTARKSRAKKPRAQAKRRGR